MYKADAPNIDSISANEITLSFVCHTFPNKLIKHLKNVRKYSIEKQEDGVYYVKGDFFPIQIIHTKKLSKETNLWLRNLTDNIEDKNDIVKLMSEYENKISDKLYSSVMDIIITANEKKFKEANAMCDALKKIILEQNREAYEQEKQEAINAAIAEKDARIAELETLLKQNNISVQQV